MHTLGCTKIIIGMQNCEHYGAELLREIMHTSDCIRNFGDKIFCDDKCSQNILEKNKKKYDDICCCGLRLITRCVLYGVSAFICKNYYRDAY